MRTNIVIDDTLRHRPEDRKQGAIRKLRVWIDYFKGAVMPRGRKNPINCPATNRWPTAIRKTIDAVVATRCIGLRVLE